MCEAGVCRGAGGPLTDTGFGMTDGWSHSHRLNVYSPPCISSKENRISCIVFI